MSLKTQPQEQKPPDFESGVKRLEEIVALLEKGEIPLEESLALYEEGKTLAARLGGVLSAAEQRVMLLVKNEDGRPAAVPFE